MKRQLQLLIISLILTGFFCSTAWGRGRRHKGPKWYEFWDDHDERYDYDDDHDHEEYEHRFNSRRIVKPRRVSKFEAREIVSETLPHWYVGEGWEKKTKRRVEVIIPLLYRGQIIGEIKLNPVNGRILPEKFRHSHQQIRISLDQARETVEEALDRVIVGREIRVGKHGNFWKVPLMFEGVEVEKIKVGTGSGNILPDLHIVEDAHRHRRRVPPVFRRPHREDID
jgi:hypothetical protein